MSLALGRNEDGSIFLGTNNEHFHNALKNKCVLGSITSQDEYVHFTNLWRADIGGPGAQVKDKRNQMRTPRFATTGGVCKKWLNIRKEHEFGRIHSCKHRNPDARPTPEPGYRCDDGSCASAQNNFIWTDGKTWNAGNKLVSFADEHSYTLKVYGPHEEKEDGTKYLAGDGGTHPHLVGLYRCGEDVATAHAIQNGEALSWQVERLLDRLKDKESVETEKRQAEQARDTAVGERETAVRERETAVGERDTAVGERETAVRERDTAVGERDTAEKDLLEARKTIEDLRKDLQRNLEQAKTIFETKGDADPELPVLTDEMMNTIQNLEEAVDKIESDDPDVRREKELTKKSIENVIGEKQTNENILFYLFCGILLLLLVIIFKR